MMGKPCISLAVNQLAACCAAVATLVLCAGAVPEFSEPDGYGNNY